MNQYVGVDDKRAVGDQVFVRKLPECPFLPEKETEVKQSMIDIFMVTGPYVAMENEALVRPGLFEEGRLPHVHMAALTRDALFRMLDLMVETGAEGSHVFAEVADDGGLLYEVWVDEWDRGRAHMISVVTSRTETTFEVEMHRIHTTDLAIEVLAVRANIVAAFYDLIHEVNGDHAIGVRVMRMLWG